MANQQFAHIWQNVPDKWGVMCMDFGENYNCHFQDEAQSAHWSYNQATIHPVVAYYRCPEESCDLVTCESFVCISDDRKHDQNAVQHFASLTNSHLRSKGVAMTTQVHFSDGASSQYKNKTTFSDASFGLQDFNCPVQKNFFGSRHGKGPCDGEGVKAAAERAVKSE